VLKRILFFIVFCFGFLSSVEGNADINNEIRKEYPTDTLTELLLAYQQDESALPLFFDSLSQMHIVERDEQNSDLATVTYFAKGSAHTDYILQSGGPDFYGLRFKQIGDSPYYFCVQKIPSNAWFNYGYNEFKRVRSASKNLYKTEVEHIYDGVVIGPDAPLSPYVNNDAEFTGTLKKFTIDSSSMKSPRDILVYLPPSYKPNSLTNILVQLDGEKFALEANYAASWKGWTPLPTILDNLHSRQKISPTIAVFIPNKDRSKDLLNRSFPDFIAKEVLPTVKQEFSLKLNKVVVSGPSRAAYAATATALRHSDTINGVLSQSGSFYYTLNEKENWPIYPQFDGKILQDYMASELLPVEFYLEVGLYDLGLARVGVNRQFRDILRLKGYAVTYSEYNGGHAHVNWRHTIADGLLHFFGTHGP